MHTSATSKFFAEWFENESYAKRLKDSQRVMTKYPNRIPVIVGPASDSSPAISAHKYLVPYDLTVGGLMHMLRCRVMLRGNEAMFLFVNKMTGNSGDVIPMTSQLIELIYREYKAADGFLYIKYDIENTFGSSK